MLLRAEKLERKKARYFRLLFCDPSFASLAAEVVPDTPAGRLLRVLFQWPTREVVEAQSEETPPVKVEPATFTAVRAPSGKVFIRNATEVWDAVKVANGWIPSWVVGGKEESSQHFNPLAPLQEAPRTRLAYTYGDNRLKTLLDAQGRKRGVW